MFKKMSNSKSFLNKITYSIIVSFVLVIILLITITFYSSRKLVMLKENESNEQQILQIKYNIELMDENVKSTCISLFNNSATKKMLYYDFSNDYEGLYYMVLTANALTSMNEYIESVYFSNYYNNVFINNSEGIIHDENFYKEISQKIGTIPLLQPIVLDRLPGEPKIDNKVLSYFMYRNLDMNKSPKEALIVNIKSEWFVGNIQRQGTNSNNSGDVFIFSQSGELLGESLQPKVLDVFVEQLFEEYKNRGYLLPKGQKYLISKSNGIDYLVTFVNVQSAGMVIVKIQNFQVVFYGINRLQRTMIEVTTISLIFALCISILLSKSIYNPIGKLVKTLKSDKKGVSDGDCQDEISFLNGFYNNWVDRIRNYEHNLNHKNLENKDSILKMMLIETPTYEKNDLISMFKDNMINFDVDGKFAVCVLRIDDYKKIESSTSSDNINLIKISVINILCEEFLEYFNAEGVDLGKDMVAIIINQQTMQQKELEIDYEETITLLIKTAMDHITEHFKITLSTSVTNLSGKTSDISDLFLTALTNIFYRLVFGKRCIIYDTMTKANIENLNSDISSDLKSNFVKAIATGDFNVIEDCLGKCLKDAATLSYLNILFALLNFTDTIWKSVNDQKNKALKSYQLAFVELRQQVFELETIDDFYSNIIVLLEQIYMDKSSGIVNEKHKLISENIKTIINNDFENKSLCLAGIAATLKMSTSYVGRIFKEQVGMSVSEYSNEVRLLKAEILLLESGLPVVEIIDSIGFDNEKYFYTLFKKRFGKTPKAYVLDRLLK